MSDLIHKTATEVVELLAAEAVSPAELLEALSARVDAVDHAVNALPIRCFERAAENARELAKKPFAERGVLKGLPVAIKDLADVEGVRSTFGSLVYRDRVAERSDVAVELLENAGALVYAKSNTPEFGAGGNTFNDVFGATRNPRAPALTVGGSSGGSAAALATGMAWLAHGSDLAGSLRTPAAFCGICSLRPSPGRVPEGPTATPFEVFGAEGPMARCVADLGLMADAMSGEHFDAGICAPSCESLSAAANAPARPLRVAMSRDLGITGVERQIVTVLQSVAETLGKEGVEIVEAHPDFSGVHAAFDVLRALDYATAHGELASGARALVKPEVIWNIDRGLSLRVEEILSARRARGRLYLRAAAFMQDYDLLLCPATSRGPFPVEERYPGYGNGLHVSEYYRWLAIAYAITMVGLPVVTLPAGRDDAGLPVGVQLVGKPHGDAALLSHARFVEDLLGMDTSPIDPLETGA